MRARNFPFKIIRKFFPEKMNKIFHDADVDDSILNNLKIAVIGFGAQGAAQAKMLSEAGCDVVVSLREGGESWKTAKAENLKVAKIEDAVREADIVHILIPDEVQKKVWESSIEPNLKDGATISFSHGFNIIYKRISPPTNSDVIMIAPKAPGTEVYKCFCKNIGVPGLVAVAQNVSGNAEKVAMAMAKKMKLTKAGVLKCSFEQETYEDLFGEQAVLCGGVAELIRYGFEVLVEAGYPPELAYFECLHELKLIVDLMFEGGISRMWEVVSNTAEYGGHTRGPRVVGPEAKEKMREVLKEVENGTFAKEWMKEHDENKMANLTKKREWWKNHLLEKTGKKVRELFEK